MHEKNGKEIQTEPAKYVSHLATTLADKARTLPPLVLAQNENVGGIWEYRKGEEDVVTIRKRTRKTGGKIQTEPG